MKATREYIEALCTALSEENGVSFQDDQGWFTDIEKRVVHYNMQEARQMDSVTAKGFLLHETGHLKYTKTDVQSALLKQYPVLQDVYNSFEDIRIENELCKEYGAFAEEALGASEVTAFLLTQTILSVYGTKKFSKLEQALHGILMQASVDGAQYTHGLARLAYDTRRMFDMDTVEFVNKYGRDLVSKVKKLRNTDQVKEWVDKEVFPLMEEWIKSAPPPQGGKGGRGKQGTCRHNHEQMMDEPSIGKILERTEKIVKNNVRIPSDKELDGLLAPYIRTLTHRLADILKEKKAMKYTGAYKRGKLLSKNTYKILTDDRRLYSKRNKPQLPEHAVYLILDESGSMSGERHTQTYIAAHLIERVCRNLRFTVRALKYDDNITKLGDSIAGYRDFRGGSNNDRGAVSTAAKDINYEEDNIVFVLTDGGVCNDPAVPMKALESAGVPVIAIGVGLGGTELRSLKNYYPRAIGAPKVEDLPKLMVKQMKEWIHR